MRMRPLPIASRTAAKPVAPAAALLSQRATPFASPFARAIDLAANRPQLSAGTGTSTGTATYPQFSAAYLGLLIAADQASQLVVTLPPTFAAAILTRIQSNPVLTAQLIGGMYNTLIPPGRPLPAGKFQDIPGGTTNADNNGSMIRAGLVQTTVYAYSMTTAKILQDLIGQLLVYPQPQPIAASTPGMPNYRTIGSTPMTFGTGRVMYLQPTDAPPQPPPSDGRQGRQVFGNIRQYRYQWQGEST